MLIYEENFSSISFNSLINLHSASRKITSSLYNPKERVGISGYVGDRNVGKMAICEGSTLGDREGTMGI